mgnify:CR=1 FL=1
MLNRLAEHYPTPRKKQEVPVWLYLASELTLKLHGSQSYHAFPRLLRSGGLIDALGPELGGRKTTHPETHDVTLSCPGFNRKNDYDRQTPCDQDFLRKFARDTEVDRLHAWFNRETPRSLRSLRLLDDEGLCERLVPCALAEARRRDARTVARQGYDAVMRGQPVYVNGRVNRAIAQAVRYLPQWLIRGVLRRAASKYRKT